MSTRAIVQAKDKDEQWSIYCHGDGYPEYLGQRVNALAEKAKTIDVNQDPRREPGTVNYDDPTWHQTSVPNVSSEACKFIAVLIGELWKDYGGAYLTTRDAETELKEDWTDIEHLYKVKLTSGKKPQLTWCTPSKNGKFIAHTQAELKKAMKA